MPAKRALRLTLLRHGPAADREEWGDKPDLERPLTEKGARRVRQVARGLWRLGVKPQLVLSSPAVRALHTAKIAAGELHVAASQIHEEVTLAPDAAPEDFLAALAALEVREVLCVGHAPHLDESLAILCGLRHGHAALALKKAGAALLRVPSTEPGEASVRALLSPWALKRVGKK